MAIDPDLAASLGYGSPQGINPPAPPMPQPLVPAGQGGNGPVMTPAEAEAAPPHDGMSLDALAAHLGAAQEQGPITSPSQSDAAAAMPSDAGPLYGADFSARVSSSGYSPAKAAQVKSGGRGIEGQINQEEADSNAAYAGAMAQSQKASDAFDKARDRETQIEAAKATEFSKAKLQIADANRGFADQVKAANDHAQAEADASIANYRVAQKNFAAAQIDPSQFWETRGTAGQFGLMASAFVADFLGAKGIKTSVMDNINQAIDRNIHAQTANMKHLGDVSDGFKELWTMQRAQSASDAEAHDRMRGFYLTSLNSEIDSRMGAFDSDLALAKGQAAKAENMKEQAKNDFLIVQHARAGAQARLQSRVNVYDAQLKASTAKAEMDAHERLAKILHPPKTVDPKSTVIIDPETGKAAWEWLGDVDKKDKSKVKNLLGALKGTNEQLEQLRGFTRTLKPQLKDAFGVTVFSDEDKRKWRAQVLTLAHGLVHANGERASDKDVEDYVKGFPIESVLNPDGVEGIIAHTQANQIRNVYGNVQQFASDLPENDQRRNITGAGHAPLSGALEDADITDKTNGAKPPDTTIDTAKQSINRPDSMSPANHRLQDKLGVLAGGKWKEFASANPEYGQETRAVGGTENLATGEGGDQQKVDKQAPAAFVGMVALGEHYATDPEAKRYLDMWANLSSSGASTAPNGEDANLPENQEKAAFAFWELSKIHGEGRDTPVTIKGKKDPTPKYGAAYKPQEVEESAPDNEGAGDSDL